MDPSHDPSTTAAPVRSTLAASRGSRAVEAGDVNAVGSHSGGLDLS